MNEVSEEDLAELEKCFPTSCCLQGLEASGMSHTDVVSWMSEVVPKLVAEIRRRRALEDLAQRV